jgi:secreted PhoX family phosphatase
VKFARLEGTRFDGRWMYFTETEDETACGKIWRLNMRTMRLELFAEGKGDGDNQLCMPDNIAFDGAGNLFVCEDREIGPNRLMFVHRRSGKISTFATCAQPYDEPTGLVFAPRQQVMFLNLMRNHDFGVTLAIKGPFAPADMSARLTAATPPPSNRSAEENFLRAESVPLSVHVAAAAALVSLRRRGRTEPPTDPLEEVAVEMGSPSPVPQPKRRKPKTL